MTREEAIINLKLSQNRIGGIKKEEWNALQMAIEALSAPQTDYISRADAIDFVAKLIWNDWEIWDDVQDRIVDGINALPSAEAVSREEVTEIKNNYINEISELLNKIDALSAEAVHGEWVRKYDDKVNCYWYECDQCGEYRPRNQFGHEYNANFCPNCGADMRGEQDE